MVWRAKPVGAMSMFHDAMVAVPAQCHDKLGYQEHFLEVAHIFSIFEKD
jgi:hypothetical protein